MVLFIYIVLLKDVFVYAIQKNLPWWQITYMNNAFKCVNRIWFVDELSSRQLHEASDCN